jgi:hypothetical protein
MSNDSKVKWPPTSNVFVMETKLSVINLVFIMFASIVCVDVLSLLGHVEYRREADIDFDADYMLDNSENL